MGDSGGVGNDTNGNTDGDDRWGDELESECGICFSEVEGSYGLLDGCRHAFCLACIRGWREMGGEVGGGAVDNVRRCPVCRVPCFLVIPSATLPRSTAEKEAATAQYKAALARIPCRHFEHDGTAVKRECPFGSSCLYAHLLPDGSPAPVPPPRMRVNAEGKAEAVGVVRLSHFFEQQARVT